jgi:hypothetical protein
VEENEELKMNPRRCRFTTTIFSKNKLTSKKLGVEMGADALLNDVSKEEEGKLEN